MRISILWSSLASYTVAFFGQLARQGCRLQLVYQPATAEAPYGEFDLSFCEMAQEDNTRLKTRLEELVSSFRPDCILMSSWGFSHFMSVCRKMRRRGIFVVASMDNQWHQTLKQCLGVLSSPWFLKPSIDTFFVAGDRQAYFAHMLGYVDVLYGLYAAEIERFACDIPVHQRPASFLFVGRLMPEKGVQQLVEAYRSYQSQVTTPWNLRIGGAGPLLNELTGLSGVEILGFVQPHELPLLMRQARAFVLPSHREAWGVVIHEAAAAGLPIIATYPCGATTWFVRDGVNGRIVQSRPSALCQGMLELHASSSSQLESMSAASTALASLWDPAKQAEYFIQRVSGLMGKSVAVHEGT